MSAFIRCASRRETLGISPKLSDILNYPTVADLAELGMWQWRLREADKGGPIPDLADLIKNPVQYLRGGGDQMDKGYAHAWGLTYYLAQHKRKEMQKYIDLVKTRKPREEIKPERELADFEACFGKLDDSFKQKWVAFMRKTPYVPPR